MIRKILNRILGIMSPSDFLIRLATGELTEEEKRRLVETSARYPYPIQDEDEEDGE